ncbi:hypothetical protein H634G_06430 [Metarhizium anisopliae BRIP 53293]|uniref:Amidoligase enzyme n=1 Tax=Metarhizium anisopliae BRIP 53293 TaxID=1291518 RepID=A0A0D9NW23_METAN|nr:hypothetical protein H634G_06430 [Metarhizium anisopliae BRIP 53293]KJK92757.1 hypothetical protein H633G_03381 [Metarhizium anisopliae BRIP 53284]
MSSTATTVNPTTIGVELEFLVVNKPGTPTNEAASSEDDRWPPVPNPKADSNHCDSESVLKICKLLKDQGRQVACILDITKSQDPLITTQDSSILLRESKTDDGQFQIHRLSIANDTDIGKLSKKTDYRVWNIKFDESPKKLPLRFAISSFEVERAIETTLGYPVLEMISPIISEPTQEKDFLDLVETLRKNFKISLNTNCGLHIHVGYHSNLPQDSKDSKNSEGPEGPEGSKTPEYLIRAKKVAAIVFLLEKTLIRELCHPDRRSAAHLRFIGDESALAVQAKYGPRHLVRHPKFKNLIESIDRFRHQLKNKCPEEAYVFRFLEFLFSAPVDAAKEVEDLVLDLLNEIEARTSLTFRKDIETIEFRYFECTFDTNMIKFWIEFVRQILSICSKSELEFEADFKDLYEMATRQEQKPGWEDWLEKLGLSQYKETCASYMEWCKELPLDDSVILPESFDL